MSRAPPTEKNGVLAATIKTSYGDATLDAAGAAWIEALERRWTLT